MPIDFTPYFAKYEALVTMADGVFEKIKREYPQTVTCKEGCSDCCHALFDLTLIEAIYLNYHFNKKFKGVKRLNLIDKASSIDRKIYKIKKNAHREYVDGKNDAEILTQMAAERVRCPLLNEEDRCDLYEHRPITCRIYGIPTASGGMSHTCGRSAFEEGKPYPTINMDVIYKQLYGISAELVRDIKSRYTKMADMLVPVSMAMITDYDDDYMGLVVKEEENDAETTAAGKIRKPRM